jgi:hypothetical protein
MAVTSSLPGIDVLIPVAPKDADALDTCVESLLKHCRNPVGAIHVVADPAFPRAASYPAAVHWIDERDAVPSVADIDRALRSAGHDHGNASWYFQQLVKLGCFALLGAHAPEHVLVIDADYALVGDVTFVDDRNRAQLALGYPFRWELGTTRPAMPERHSAPASAARLVPGWRPVDPYSGMQHHMVFDRTVLTSLVERVEREHRRPFWEAFLATLEPGKWTGASEYVLYRHFACRFFGERVVTRHLPAVDVIQSDAPGGFTLSQVVDALRTTEFSAAGCHRFLNYAGRLATMDYIPEELRREIAPLHQPLKLRLTGGELAIAPALAPLTLP